MRVWLGNAFGYYCRCLLVCCRAVLLGTWTAQARGGPRRFTPFGTKGARRERVNCRNYFETTSARYVDCVLFPGIEIFVLAYSVGLAELYKAMKRLELRKVHEVHTIAGFRRDELRQQLRQRGYRIHRPLAEAVGRHCRQGASPDG